MRLMRWFWILAMAGDLGAIHAQRLLAANAMALDPSYNGDLGISRATASHAANAVVPDPSNLQVDV